MDTTQINAHLYERLPGLFGGTWPIDEVPTGVNNRVCYVVNLSPSWHNGSHWVAVYLDGGGGAEYFCSYGSRIPVGLQIQLGYDAVLENDKQLQQLTSDICGEYCILYLLCRCSGYTMSEFVDCFYSNSRINDAIVETVWEE